MGVRPGARACGDNEREEQQAREKGASKHVRNVLALGVVLVGGCGHASNTPTATSTPTARPTSTPHARVTISITAPRAGTRVKAGRSLTVAGRATPGTTVVLDAGCAPAGCHALARASARGRWRATLRPRAAHTTVRVSTLTSGTLASVRVAVAHERPAAATHPGTVSEAEPQVTPRPRPTRAVLIGDSLAVGIEQLLPPLLHGYSFTVNARTGRPMGEGMGIEAQTDVRGAVLAISLFTNDDPSHVDELEAAVRKTVADVGPNGCAVWATIVRPPLNGVSYDAANQRLEALEAELSPRLILVPWAQTIAATPKLIGADGVHPTPDGYQARAALYAQAIESCGG